jgi:hypothetical protein
MSTTTLLGAHWLGSTAYVAVMPITGAFFPMPVSGYSHGFMHGVLGRRCSEFRARHPPGAHRRDSATDASAHAHLLRLAGRAFLLQSDETGCPPREEEAR